jgi:putative acetyltransferase
MLIRAEVSSDAASISSVIERAFASHPFSSHNEQSIVHALRTAGALAVSLVAVNEPNVVGHVAVSPVTISDGTPHWYGLGPVAVEPAVQRRGVGSALVKAGLERARSLGAVGCVVLGEPAYYGRFGFQSGQGLAFTGAPPEYFMSLAFSGTVPRAEVLYHRALATEI